MLKVEYQGQFKKDYKLAVKRGCNLKLLADVITMLVNEKPLPPKYKDHSLADSRNYKRMRACRIQPDWLLVWRPEPFSASLCGRKLLFAQYVYSMSCLSWRFVFFISYS